MNQKPVSATAAKRLAVGEEVEARERTELGVGRDDLESAEIGEVAEIGPRLADFEGVDRIGANLDRRGGDRRRRDERREGKS